MPRPSVGRIQSHGLTVDEHRDRRRGPVGQAGAEPVDGITLVEPPDGDAGDGGALGHRVAGQVVGGGVPATEDQRQDEDQEEHEPPAGALPLRRPPPRRRGRGTVVGVVLGVVSPDAHAGQSRNRTPGGAG